MLLVLEITGRLLKKLVNFLTIFTTGALTDNVQLICVRFPQIKDQLIISKLGNLLTILFLGM